MIKRSKLQDIAKIVGVTKMTVSRFFNNPQSVAPLTREKISSAIDELGFIPNRVPAIMSQSSSRALGLVVPSFSNLVFSELIDGVEEACRNYGYNVLMVHSGYDTRREEEQVAALLSYQVDGIILCDSCHTPLTTRRLVKSGLPVAETMSIPDEPIDIVLGIDHARIIHAATSALLECGRRKIAYFGVRLDPRTMDRQRGYEQALAEYGLKSRSLQTTLRSNFSIGLELMKKAADSGDRPDAVICTNDDVAVGALIACQDLGIRLPEELGILGYNGLNIGQASIPRLCSIATPRFEMGYGAVKAIAEQLQHGRRGGSSAAIPGCRLTPGGTLRDEEQQALAEKLKKLEPGSGSTGA